MATGSLVDARRKELRREVLARVHIQTLLELLAQVVRGGGEVRGMDKALGGGLLRISVGGATTLSDLRHSVVELAVGSVQLTLLLVGVEAGLARLVVTHIVCGSHALVLVNLVEAGGGFGLVQGLADVEEAGAVVGEGDVAVRAHGLVRLVGFRIHIRI